MPNYGAMNFIQLSLHCSGRKSVDVINACGGYYADQRSSHLERNQDRTAISKSGCLCELYRNCSIIHVDSVMDNWTRASLTDALH